MPVRPAKKQREGKREEKVEWQLQSFLRYTQTQKILNYLFDLSKTFLITLLHSPNLSNFSRRNFSGNWRIQKHPLEVFYQKH